MRGDPCEDFGHYAYHATERKRLSSIRRHGLAPSTGVYADEPRSADQPAVYFAVTPRFVRAWGSIVLRFPWPAESYEDEYADTMVVCDTIVASNWWTPRWIPPQEIEVFSAGRWRALR